MPVNRDSRQAGRSDMLPANSLSRIVYLSRIYLPVGQREPDVIFEILKTSVERNQSCGVTGSLLALNGWFVQLIEGPASLVDATFDRISRDLRHGFVKVVERRPVSERLFGDWAMCGRALSPTNSGRSCRAQRHPMADQDVHPRDRGSALLSSRPSQNVEDTRRCCGAVQGDP